jgi:hypothetical protein
MKKQTPLPENLHHRWYLTSIVLFGLCVAGVFLLARHCPYPWELPHDLYLWLYILLVVVFVVAMARLFLKDLQHRGKLAGMLSDVAGHGVVRTIAQRFMTRRKRTRHLAYALTPLVMLTLLLVIVLDSHALLFDQNMMLLGAFERDRGPARTPDSTVSFLSCYTMGKGTEDRLHFLLKVTEDLKRAGAKVVVMKLPPFVHRPYYAKLVENIRGTGVAVFGLETEDVKVAWKTAGYRTWTSTRDSSYRSTGVLSASQLTSTGDPNQMAPFACFVPHGYFSEVFDQKLNASRRDTSSDVILEVLRKWNDWPDTVRPGREGRELFFGSYRIPVSVTGLAIVRPAGTHIIPVTAGDDWENDTSGYWNLSQRPGHPANDLSEFAPEIRGRIVVLGYNETAAPLSSGRWWEMYTCASIVTAALQHEFVTVRDDLDIWLTLLVSILSLFVAIRLRPLPAFVTLLFFAILLAAGTLWLYLSAAAVVQVVYPLAALALNMVILPLAKIFSEVKNGAVHGTPSHISS